MSIFNSKSGCYSSEKCNQSLSDSSNSCWKMLPISCTHVPGEKTESVKCIVELKRCMTYIFLSEVPGYNAPTAYPMSALCAMSGRGESHPRGLISFAPMTGPCSVPSIFDLLTVGQVKEPLGGCWRGGVVVGHYCSVW